MIWSSSNETIANVDGEGMVSAVAAGDVTITASASDDSGVIATYTFTVIPPTKGDSNDNDVVTITDAVNTANYAVGNEVEVFCFEAADVNGDNRITLADASGTITELLNQPVQSSASALRMQLQKGIESDIDNIVISDYTCLAGNSTEIEVFLENTIDYVALQADITAPDNMTIVNVLNGSRSEAYHNIVTHRIDNQTVRIALFDLNNSTFTDNSDAILRIIVKSEASDCGDSTMSNILSADANANE